MGLGSSTSNKVSPDPSASLRSPHIPSASLRSPHIPSASLRSPPIVPKLQLDKLPKLDIPSASLRSPPRPVPVPVPIENPLKPVKAKGPAYSKFWDF